jgi:hypothetical protein
MQLKLLKADSKVTDQLEFLLDFSDAQLYSKAEHFLRLSLSSQNHYCVNDSSLI